MTELSFELSGGGSPLAEAHSPVYDDEKELGP